MKKLLILLCVVLIFPLFTGCSVPKCCRNEIADHGYEYIVGMGKRGKTVKYDLSKENVILRRVSHYSTNSIVERHGGGYKVVWQGDYIDANLITEPILLDSLTKEQRMALYYMKRKGDDSKDFIYYYRDSIIPSALFLEGDHCFKIFGSGSGRQYFYYVRTGDILYLTQFTKEEEKTMVDHGTEGNYDWDNIKPYPTTPSTDCS